MRQRGFTLVELLVVVPGVLIIVAVMVAFLFSLYSNLLTKNGQLELEVNAQSALFAIRDDPFFAIRFAGSNQDDTTDSHAPGGSWNAIDDNAFIVYEAAFDANRQSSTRQLSYKKDEPNACNSPDISQNQFSVNSLIYFIQNGTLYRRILIPDQSLNCLTTYRLQSCPSASATPSCPADTIVAENVKSFAINYFDRAGVALSNASLQSNPDLFIQAQRADIVLELEKLVNAQPIGATAKISIKKVQ